MNQRTAADNAAEVRAPLAPQPVLAALRQATRASHARLDRSINLAAHLRTSASYALFLLRYLDIYRPLESRLYAAPFATILSRTYTGKIAVIEKDLLALGHDASAHPWALRDYLLPDLNDVNNFLGALYVIEGSALGGQIIYREIEKTLHLDRNNGAAFFFGDGEQTSAHWRRFTSLLEKHVTLPDQAANAALATFAAFEKALLAPISAERA